MHFTYTLTGHSVQVPVQRLWNVVMVTEIVEGCVFHITELDQGRVPFIPLWYLIVLNQLQVQHFEGADQQLLVSRCKSRMQYTSKKNVYGAHWSRYGSRK